MQQCEPARTAGETSAAPDTSGPCRSLGVGILLAIFCLAHLPYVAHYVVHHPDERHYTDGAISMLDTGDYWSPRSPDGSFRFRKPILTYWCVAASYRLLGITPFASRLPFLFAGAIVVLLTYRLAFRISRHPTVAAMAAGIIACHPILILSSTRSIPDILLCLFLLLSGHGFLGIIACGRPSRGDYWMAYLGCGLAVVSKGLPAAAFLTYSWAFALANPWQRLTWRRLLHLPSMTVGASVALGWFVVTYATHGSLALEAFWADQVAERVTESPWRPAYQFPLFLTLCVVFFTPWIWPLLARPRHAWSRLITARPQHVQVARFVLVWTLCYAVFAGLVTKFSTRYVLPVCPLLAVLLALTLVRLEPAYARRWLRIGLAMTSVVLLAVGVTVTVVNLQLRTGVLELGLALTLVAAGLAVAVRGAQGTRTGLALSLSVIVCLTHPLAFLALRHVALPDQGTQIARRLEELETLDGRPIQMVGKPALVSKIRVCSAGKAKLIRSERSDLAHVPPEAVLILPSRDLTAINVEGYDLHVGSNGMKDLTVVDLASSLLRGHLTDYLRRQRQRFVIAVEATSARPVRFAGGMGRSHKTGRKW